MLLPWSMVDAPHNRILVVDDDAGSRTGLERLLGADGFVVTTASDGEQALIAANRAIPDLVLTDLEMPRMNGVTLCQRLHEVDRALPVILITAHSDLASADEAMRAGAEDYLVKPVHYEALLWRIRRILAARSSDREHLAARARLQARHEQQRDEYLALVSHDLLNPLSNVLICVALLKESLERRDLPADLALVDRAQRNVERMRTMLGELSEATSLEADQHSLVIRPCELRALVDDVVGRMADANARRTTVVSDDTSPHLVLADASQLERVIANLLTNALKYSAADAPVVIRTIRSGSSIQLAVTDRGIGIAPDSIPSLFDRYYRTKEGKARASGLGLGLYIARLIMELHGGRIEVTSELGHGSTFMITLPSAAPLAPHLLLTGSEGA